MGLQQVYYSIPYRLVDFFQPPKLQFIVLHDNYTREQHETLFQSLVWARSEGALLLY